MTWRSKKQTVVARSSVETKLRLKMLLDELKVAGKMPMRIYCDKAAIKISHNPVHHDRTKHVEVDRHFIKEKIDKGTICIIYVPTSKQAADLLTKGYGKPGKPLFEKLVGKLGMYDLYSPA